MSINHHPDSELLAAYAAGSLPLSQALCVSAHIEMCHECKTNSRRLNNLGGFVFEQSDREKVSHELKAKVLAQLDKSPDKAPSPERTPVKRAEENTEGNNSHIPRSLKQFIPTTFENLHWKRVSPSIKQAHLCTDSDGSQIALLSIKAGGKAGHHTHLGEELTMILKGAFSDETGIFQKGDFMLRNDNHKHRPIATKDGECICLTVLNAPIQFTGYFNRWLNPILRRNHPNPSPKQIESKPMVSHEGRV